MYFYGKEKIMIGSALPDKIRINRSQLGVGTLRNKASGRMCVLGHVLSNVGYDQEFIELESAQCYEDIQCMFDHHISLVKIKNPDTKFSWERHGFCWNGEEFGNRAMKLNDSSRANWLIEEMLESLFKEIGITLEFHGEMDW